MPSAADYVNRTVDVLAFQPSRPSGDALMLQTLAVPGQGGLVCTGIQKLAQRVLVEFLTDVGSLRYLPTRGTIFPGQLRKGYLRTTIDATQAFWLAVHQLKASLTAEENDSTPLDEAYGDIELIALVVAGDKVTLRMKIISKSGDARQYIVPIPVKIGS